MKRTRTLPITGLLLLLCCFFLAPAQAETVYKWTDAQGTVHFGERPPEGVDAELVTVAGANESSAVDPYAEAREKLTTPAEARQKQEEEAKQREQQQQEAARMAAACEAHKARLEELIPRSRVLQQNPDGTTRMLTNDERQNMIDESQDFVNKNCN